MICAAETELEMKLKAGQRALIVLLSLILIAVIVTVLLCCWGAITPSDISSALQYLTDNIWANIIVTVLGAFIVVYAFCMMFVASKAPEPMEALIKVTDNGTIHITLATLTALAVKYSRSVSGIRDVRVSTSVIADGVQVRIRAAVINEAVIPEVTANVQQTVRDNIENMVGLHVTEVKIIVDNSITAGA